ncbi:MAG: hypothetical protein U0531_09245 [Dehalococcoidia bacterium]
MVRRLALGAVVLGIVAQLLSLTLARLGRGGDAVTAAHEGALSLRDPLHVAFALGVALAALGAAALVVAPLAAPGESAPPAPVTVAVGAATVLALALSAFLVAARSGVGADRHEDRLEDHLQEEADTARRLPLAAQTAPVARFGAGGPEGSGSVGWDQLREADAMLTLARSATEKYRDVQVARADGYVQLSQVLPGVGAHFVHPDLATSGAFDLFRPSTLLYDRTAQGDFELVGVSWSIPRNPGDRTPPAYFGPLARWHYHESLCFVTRNGALSAGGDTAAGCRAAGGVFVPESGWVLQAWLFRPSPEGVFAYQNSTIKAASATPTGR